MADYIEETFGIGGHLASINPEFRPRAGQIEIARAVDHVLAKKIHLVAEAPTGTGKSFAYLVPTLYHALSSPDGQRQRVLVVTENIALTEQLINKDLPDLAVALPWPFTFKLVKGRNNYLCPDRLSQARRDGDLAGAVKEPGGHLIPIIEKWAAKTTTGDKSELAELPPAPIWDLFSVGADDCKGKKCGFYATCPSVKARREAQHADVVVTNYHLLFWHIKLRALTGLDSILPPYDIVVLDEGHRTAEIGRDLFGFELSMGSIRRIGRFLAAKFLDNRALWDNLVQTGESFFGKTMRFKDSLDYKARLRQGHPLDPSLLINQLLDVSTFYQKEASSGMLKANTDPDDLEKYAGRAVQLAKDFHEACIAPITGNAYFIEDTQSRGRRWVSIKCRPKSVADILAAQLFEKTPVVAISATMAVSNRFDHAVEEFGIQNNDRQEIVSESPFDWRKQALFIVPGGMPDPSKDRARFDEVVQKLTGRVMELTKGRTMALFTSVRARDACYEYVKRLRLPYQLLRQGDMPNTALVEEFKKDVSSCLFGCASFWSGVDIPGEALSCVIIDKLPFLTMDDPVYDLVAESDRNAFNHYMVPRAVIEFKQAFGRLIRRETDRGVVVMMDPRVKPPNKNYSGAFWNSLPAFVSQSENIEHIPKFLDWKWD